MKIFKAGSIIKDEEPILSFPLFVNQQGLECKVYRTARLMGVDK